MDADSKPKMFTVYRNYDESGVSGVGRVLDGVTFHNGKTVVCWRTDVDAKKHGTSSLGVYDSYEDFIRIHVDAHPSNLTKIIFI